MVLDTQSVHVAAGVPTTTTGHDPAKRVPGRKRGLAVDVLGLVIAVVVLAANTHDNAAGIILLDQVTEHTRGTVRKALVDQGLNVVSFGVLGSLHRVVMVERMVPDELWELFQRVVPPAPSRPQGGGRRRYGDREVLAAIVFVATTGCTWRQLPPVFGPSGPTAHRRFTEWTAARVWAKLHRVILDELGARGDLDWSRCAIDSVNMRALKGGT